jgi:hypothetical protein
MTKTMSRTAKGVMFLTYRYRVKDATTGKPLARLGPRP